MTPKEILIEQFLCSYDQKGWFVPLKDSLTGLTAEQAVWNGGTENHSVYEIVNHIIYWNETWLNKFKKNPVKIIETDNKNTFNPGVASISPAEWDEAVKKLFSVMDTWAEGLKGIDDSFLNVPVHNEADAPWSSYISQIIMHIIYHTGQIVTIRKMQGSWDPKLGVEA